MTTAGQFREAVTRPASTVSIAGVAWPTYKLVALLVGLLVFAIIALVTASAAPAVLGGAGAGTLTWLLGLGIAGSTHR